MTEWISVTERLPEYSRKTLVWCVHKEIQFPAIAYFNPSNGWYAEGFSHFSYDVTHWQPIEPPINLQIKGEDDELES